MVTASFPLCLTQGVHPIKQMSLRRREISCPIPKGLGPPHPSRAITVAAQNP